MDSASSIFLSWHVATNHSIITWEKDLGNELKMNILDSGGAVLFLQKQEIVTSKNGKFETPSNAQSVPLTQHSKSRNHAHNSLYRHWLTHQLAILTAGLLVISSPPMRESRT